MQLGRYNVSTERPPLIASINLSSNPESSFFAIATEGGYEIWRTFPLALLRRRALPGTLERVLLVPGTPLIVLQGGGNSPVYPPNKVVIYHDALGLAVAELEFGERIRGITVRHGAIVIALSRRAAAFTFGMARGDSGDVKGKSKASPGGFWLRKLGEWETAENLQGLMAISTAPSSTLLALPGRQAGHVQLVTLPPCPPLSTQSSAKPASFRSPIILAHTHPLSSLTCSSDGMSIVTTSARGTLLRVWDTQRGHLVQELRRGVDRAEMWGASFEPVPSSPPASPSSSTRGVPGSVVGWSDKGTIHIWSPSDSSSHTLASPSITNLLSRNLPLPKYFSSTASFAQYHLPRKNPHAFASVVNAAAGKTGAGSRRADEGAEDELAERFVVGWIRVRASTGASTGRASGSHRHPAGGGPTTSRERSRDTPGGQTMGTREERRSFGSDATSRTATPTLRSRPTAVPIPSGLSERSETPTMTRRQSSLYSIDTIRSRTTSGSAGSKITARKTALPTSHQRAATASVDGQDASRSSDMEWQLVAITHSGDWYRLRIPSAADTGSDGTARGGGKCELVEYRRLGVGGGGW